jgi:Diacylglycerol kinase catalytic domain
MVAVALLSNPRSTGNRAILPRIRAYCASQPDIFHYEVEHVDQIGEALASIALVRPRVIAINGGDGTVQAALTELYNGHHFPPGQVPPVAVLPNGKTNLIALDLGATGDPLEALALVVGLAHGPLEAHIVERELISLSHGEAQLPVLGMFLGGAGLADTILYCRHTLYPWLPNGLAHAVAGVTTLLTLLLCLIPGMRSLIHHKSSPVTVTVRRDGAIYGRFAVLIVTTLEKLLFNTRTGMQGQRAGRMKLLAVNNELGALLRMLGVALFGGLGERQVNGLHYEQGDVICIEGDRSSVILDGEIFETSVGHPIMLRSTDPVPFLKLAA